MTQLKIKCLHKTVLRPGNKIKLKSKYTTCNK